MSATRPSSHGIDPEVRTTRTPDLGRPAAGADHRGERDEPDDRGGERGPRRAPVGTGVEHRCGPEQDDHRQGERRAEHRAADDRDRHLEQCLAGQTGRRNAAGGEQAELALAAIDPQRRGGRGEADAGDSGQCAQRPHSPGHGLLDRPSALRHEREMGLEVLLDELGRVVVGIGLLTDDGGVRLPVGAPTQFRPRRTRARQLGDQPVDVADRLVGPEVALDGAGRTVAVEVAHHPRHRRRVDEQQRWRQHDVEPALLREQFQCLRAPVVVDARAGEVGVHAPDLDLHRHRLGPGVDHRRERGDVADAESGLRGGPIGDEQPTVVGPLEEIDVLDRIVAAGACARRSAPCRPPGPSSAVVDVASARVNASRSTHVLPGSRPPSGAKGSAGSGVSLSAVATYCCVAPVSRGHRSSAWTATDAVPTDETNSGTDAIDAAVTAAAAATVASTPGRRSNSTGARVHGVDVAVDNAARNRPLTGRRSAPSGAGTRRGSAGHRRHGSPPRGPVPISADRHVWARIRSPRERKRAQTTNHCRRGTRGPTRLGANPFAT